MRNVKEYHRPQQLAEALELLARSEVITAPIGGGSDLIAAGSREVEAVVDLQDLNLAFIETEADALRIGATTTLQTLIDAPPTAKAWGGKLHAVLSYTAARNLREAGAIAGTLVSAESNQPLAVLLLALDAALVVLDHRSESIVALGDFLSDRNRFLTNALISEIVIPLPRAGERAAFEKVSRTPADMPIVCVAARARVDAGVGRDVRVGVGGVGARPMRVAAIEQALEGRAMDAQAITRSAFDSIETMADFMGSAEYRREMALVLLQRALKQLG